MKQSCVSAFARVARFCALVAVALGFGAGMLQAQSTGKIEGRVRDQNGAPINNAQVIACRNGVQRPVQRPGLLLHEQRAGRCGDGPCGLHRVPGGQRDRREGPVGSDHHAGRHDGSRRRSVEAINVVSVQPLVPRDEVTTKQRIDGDFTSHLPVDRIGNVLALQPGVTANAAGGGLSIRGGRTDENVTYIDGVPVQAGNRGTAVLGGNEISVNTGSFEEATVTTGASSAEFGNAQAGVISITSKAGNSQRFTGNLGYESDAMFSSSSSLGFTKVQGAFGGPLARGLTFYISGGLEGQKSPQFGMGSAANTRPSCRSASTRRWRCRARWVPRRPTPRSSTS